jgi:hypothetical protein
MKRKMSYLLPVLFILFFVPSAARAQGELSAADVQALLKRVETLEARVADLEKTATACAAPAKPAVAPAPAAASKAEVSGTAWISYAYDTNGADENDNEFALTRMYINYKGKVAPNTEYRLTTDIRTSNTYTDSGGDKVSTGRFDAFMKFGYLSFNNIVPGGALIAGAQPTPWTDFEDKFWKYRPVSKSLTDQWGFLTSSDFGVSLKGTLDGGFDYHLMVSNGEGYGANEETGNKNGKDFSLRLAYQPTKKSPTFALYGDNGSSKNTDSDRWGALVGRVADDYHYGLNYIHGTDGAKKSGAYSLYGGFNFPRTRWALFARYDNFDPNLDASNDKQNLTILGFSYKINQTTNLYLSNQHKNAPNNGDDNDISAILHVNF